MNWEAATYWFTVERYEMRIIRPDLWIIFGPDGWADMGKSMSEVRELAEAHLKEHPLPK